MVAGLLADQLYLVHAGRGQTDRRWLAWLRTIHLQVQRIAAGVAGHIPRRVRGQARAVGERLDAAWRLRGQLHGALPKRRRATAVQPPHVDADGCRLVRW